MRPDLLFWFPDLLCPSWTCFWKGRESTWKWRRKGESKTQIQISNICNEKSDVEKHFLSTKNSRFRPNIFIDGGFSAFAEDKWPWVSKDQYHHHHHHHHHHRHHHHNHHHHHYIIIIIISPSSPLRWSRNSHCCQLHYNVKAQVKIGEVVFRHSQLCDRCDFTQVSKTIRKNYNKLKKAQLCDRCDLTQVLFQNLRKIYDEFRISKSLNFLNNH